MNRSRFDPPHQALVHVVLLVLTLDFVQGALARPLVRPYVYSDFVTYYSAATAFARGQNPYDFAALQQAGKEIFAGWVGRYLYPPPFAACAVRPLAHLPFAVARRVWVLVETAAYLAALVLLQRLVFASAASWGWLAVAALGLPYAPFRFDLHLGSVSGILLLLLVSFMLALKRGQTTRAGLALAAAILLKLSPALVVPVLFLAGRAGLVWRALLAIVLLVLAALPWTGVDAYLHYAQDVIPTLVQASFTWFTNQSVDAFFARLLTANTDTTAWLVNPDAYRSATIAVSAGVLAVLASIAWRARRHAHAPDLHVWLAATALVAALLVARVTWEYMLVLALPCFALWLHDIGRGGVGAWRAGLAAVAFAGCALPIPYAEHPIRSGIGLLLMSPRTYGLALLLVLTLAHLWRLTARPATTAANETDRVGGMASGG